jgi:D-serine deaminase-like pyridoxal phosphate-dependent protein
VTCAKLGGAEVMAAAGIKDILIDCQPDNRGADRKILGENWLRLFARI